jgi:hypothetical protein
VFLIVESVFRVSFDEAKETQYLPKQKFSPMTNAIPVINMGRLGYDKSMTHILTH